MHQDCFTYSTQSGNNSTTQYTQFKGTVPRDFLPLVFFYKQFLLAPVDKHSNDFDFFLYSRRYSIISVLRRCQRHRQCMHCRCRWHRWIIPWHFYCFRELHRCQKHRQKNPHRCHWHRQSMHSPVSLTPAKHAFKVRKNHPTIIKSFSSPVSMTSAMHRKVEYLREYSKKIEIVTRLVYWGQEKLFEEKNQWWKIWWHCPFNRIAQMYRLYAFCQIVLLFTQCILHIAAIRYLSGL